MCNGYHVGDEDIQPDLEDEFLCEYVDGTMDPVIREVFEEYVRANPDLREHIECLRHTRLLLCRYGCRCRAPRDLHNQLRQRITCDLLKRRTPFHIVAADRLKDVATVSCAVAALLMLGLVAGASFVEADEDYPRVVTTAVMTTSEVGPPVHHGETAIRTHQPSVPGSFPYSPRHRQVAPLSQGYSLVAVGIENEMRSASQTMFASAVEQLAP